MDGAPLVGGDYSVFGLMIRSSIPLPELLPGAGEGTPDVTIRIAPVSRPDAAKPGINVDGDALLLIIPDVGRYRIVGGSSITVQPQPGVPDRNVRLFLLGSAFGALLHQRGLLPLHANAVEIDGNAVAFMGASGAGKSTLAAWFHDRGYRIIADDVCVVGYADGFPLAQPGLPRLRLWAETLKFMARSTAEYERSYVGMVEEFDKFDVPIDRSAAAHKGVPLAALYLLSRAKDFSIQQLHGIEATEVVFANTYRGAYVSAASAQLSHWNASLRLVQSAPIFRAAREWNLARLNEQCRRLLDHAAEQIRSHSLSRLGHD